MSISSFVKNIFENVKDQYIENHRIKIVKFNVSSAEYFQKQRKKTYLKAGNVDNSIESKWAIVKRDKKNKADPNALAVYLYGIKIGYLFRSDQIDFYKTSEKRKISIRQYYYNEMYRAELIVKYK